MSDANALDDHKARAVANVTAEIDTHLRHGSCGRPWLDELGTR